MAAVRATNQESANGQYYTEKDWNTQSDLGASLGCFLSMEQDGIGTKGVECV